MKVIYYRVALVNNEWVLTHIARCQAGKGVTYMVNQRNSIGEFLSTIETEEGDTWAYLGLVFSEYHKARGITWEPVSDSGFDPALKDGPSKEDFELYMKEYMENLNRIYQGDPALKKITFFSQSHKTLSEDVVRAKLSANKPKPPPIKLLLLERTNNELRYSQIKVAGCAFDLSELPTANVIGMRHPDPELGMIYLTFDYFALVGTGAQWVEPANHFSIFAIIGLGNTLTTYDRTTPGSRRFDIPDMWFGSNDKELLTYEQVQQFLLTGATYMNSVEAKYQDNGAPYTTGEVSSSEATESPKATQEKDIYYQIADVRRQIDKRRHELATLNNQLNELEHKLAQSNEIGRNGVPYPQQSGYGYQHFTRC